jgi:hypothetical protein
MKKTLAALIAFTFLGSSLSIPAYAAVKAGAKCSTKGQVKTSQGKKYTCISKSKKLVWSAVAATPKKSQVIEPETIPVSVPSAPTSISNLEANSDGIPYSSWEKMNANLIKYPTSTLDISIQYGPNTPERYSTQITKDAVMRGARVMGGVKQPLAVKFYQYNKVDVNWGKEQATKYQAR